MNKLKHSKSSLFLMEIMLNILFFSVLVTMCLQLFFKAHSLSESAATLHRAAATCSSIAEIYQSGSQGKDLLLGIYPNAIRLDQNILIYFDDTFTECTQEESNYHAYISFHEDELNTATVDFFVQDNATPVYTLDFSAYHSQTPASMLGGGTNE